MAQRYYELSKIFGEGELLLLEDALNNYNPANMSETEQKRLDDLRKIITTARRWRHQFGKSEH